MQILALTPHSFPTSFLSSFHFFLPCVFCCQRWHSQPGVTMSSGDRPVSRLTADAVGAARARLSARLSWQLLAESAGAVRLGP